MYSDVGNPPAMELLERSSLVRFFRSQIVAGRFGAVMLLLGRRSSVTAPLVHRTSVQSHGDGGEGFHDRRDGGSPSWRFRVSRIVSSVAVVCEITWQGTVMLSKRNK